MPENSHKSSMPEKVRRRKRIERMKLILWLIVVLWIMISIVLTIVMGIGIHSLNNKIKVLQENQLTIQNYINENFSKKETTEDNTSEETSDNSSDEPSSEAEQVSVDESELDKAVYLTFDDGPSENTEEILDILDEYDVKATFFVCGHDDEETIPLYKEILDRGHTIGLHSYSHNYSSIYDSLKAFQKDFYKIQDFVKDCTGETITLYRFPGGSSNTVSNVDMDEFIKWFNEIGVTYYDWNVSSEDAVSNDYNAEDVIDVVMKEVKDHSESVVLMHDTAAKGETVRALPTLLSKLQKKGYTILPISDNTQPIQHVKAESVS